MPLTDHPKCGTCKRTLDNETPVSTLCRVIVGIRYNEDGGLLVWLVRNYCPTCAESYYHSTVYGHGHV